MLKSVSSCVEPITTKPTPTSSTTALPTGEVITLGKVLPMNLVNEPGSLGSYVPGVLPQKLDVCFASETLKQQQQSIFFASSRRASSTAMA